MVRAAFALATLVMAAAHAAAADAPRLGLPIDCIPGKTCYIEDYVDADPGPGQRDFMCGVKSRDGHRGTDIVLLSFEDLKTGVNVLAAAPGVVSATRDGVKDQAITPKTRASIKGRECGNAVRIDHGGGWQTLYCHMKRGSVQVRKGDTLARGAILGQVGLSGLTNVPHVHIGVLKDGQIVDPFNPDNSNTCGASDGTGLWEKALAYDRAGLFTAAFATSVPGFDAIKSGAARQDAARPDQPLVLYGHTFYARPGDRLIFTAHGPDGEIFRHDTTLDDPQVQLFRAFGRKAPSGGWPAGAYRGYVRLQRGEEVLALRHADIIVAP